MNPYDSFDGAIDDRPVSRYGREDDGYGRDSYRRRSPMNDRRRPPPRGRSRSPIPIDRYQPGDRERAPRGEFHYDARPVGREREDRRRAPSPTAANIDRYVPGQDTGKPMVRNNPLVNPLTLEMQVGFNYFAEWWRVDNQIKEEKERVKHGGRRPADRVKGEKEAREDRDKERARIQVAYDQYKLDLQSRMARSFVHLHKGEEWFKEKYVAELRDPIRAKLMDFRKGLLADWEADLENGVFDDFTLEGIYRNDSDGAGGVIEKEEGEATGVGEVLGVLDLVPAKGGELRDESILQPALLIKTLAPNVSREKVEAFCKEHLGEQAGGFKWLSLSDPNPVKKCHRIGWIMLHPGGDEDEEMNDADRGDGREEDEEGESKPANGASGKTPAQKALDLVNEKVISDSVRGDFTCHVGVHNPPGAPRKKALWDLFSAPERIERDLELARRLVAHLEAEMGVEDEGGLAKIDRKVELLRGISKKDKFLDNDDEIKLFEEGEDEGAVDEETDDDDLIVTKKTLDLIVEYLRRVFHFCFFCVFESDSVHELSRKCPGGHLRRPRSGMSTTAKAAAKASSLREPFPLATVKREVTEDGETSPVEERRPFKPQNKTEQQLQRAFNWVRTFEDKILQLLEPESADLKKLGGKSLEDAITEDLSKFVKQEDESKFRCKVPECTKLFKAEHFWRKHVEKRHDDWFAAQKADFSLVNAYVLDPSHIAPSRSDANSNGHFPIPHNNHSAAGTPRGFSLQNMFNFQGNNGFQQHMQNPHNNQAFIPNMAAPFMTNPPPNPDQSSMHNPGAMRRGGNNRFPMQRPGPYDRRSGPGPRTGNNTFLAGGNPMRTGFVAQGGGGGGGKWGDGAGGTSVPREAVQGRSIRSYEDLDAQPASGAANGRDGAAGGAAELDY